MLKSLFGGNAPQKEPDIFEPRMPQVDVPANLEDIFENARKTANGEVTVPGYEPGSRFVSIVTPGRMIMTKLCPPPGSIPEAQTVSLATILPPSRPTNVAAISYTEQKAIMTDISKAIPFYGMLMGFAYLGHTVWVFEGHPSALAAGCRNADVLIIDSGMAPYMPRESVNVAASVMRHKEIYMHDRKTFQLGALL